VKALRERCEVVVISPTPWMTSMMQYVKPYWPYYAAQARKTEIDGIDVYRPRYPHFPTKWGFPLDAVSMRLALKRLVGRLKASFDFDLIHAHTLCPDGFAAVGLGRDSGVPVVCTIHGGDINIYPDWTNVVQAMTRWTIERVDALISVSSQSKERTLALGAPRREVSVIPNGADLRRFAPLDKAACRQEMELPHDAHIIVYASRLDKVKGLTFLLSALKTVVERVDDCLLVLAGEGDHREQLLLEVSALGLQEHVMAIGRRPHQEIAKWMNAGDLVVLPSLTEGSPLPVYEAMACGKPIIASRVGGIPEIITSDDYGLLVPPADPEALAEALDVGLCKVWDPQKIRQHSVTYSWDSVATQLMGVYSDVSNGLLRTCPIRE
jgi:glycosyltransferase involved in cell wall biosynthesis